MEQTQKRHNQNKEPSLLVGSLIGGGIGLAVTVLSALLMPFILLGMGDPNALITLFASVCVFVGGAVGAVVSAKLCGEPSAVSGLLSASVMLLPLMLVSFLVPGERNFVLSAIMAAVLLASSVLSSLAAAKISSSRKNSMKKMMKRR